MPQFISIHEAPPIDPSEFAGYAPEIAKSELASFQQVYLNFGQGFIISVYEGASEKAVRDEFDRIGLPVTSVTEVQLALDKAALAASLS